MKLKYLGYRERKAQTRELTIAELKLSIIEVYVNKGVKEVQLIDITSGDTITFNLFGSNSPQLCCVTN